MSSDVQIPPEGAKITIENGKLRVPDNPIIPFIEGDGTGIDIWPAAKMVLDAAASKYGRTIEWSEVLAGEKAFNETGDWLPQATIDSFSEHLIGIKGPLTTPIGGGFRSLNVAIRQIMDLYVCLRPVRWFDRRALAGKRNPQLVDMAIFRENTEDIYAGIEVRVRQRAEPPVPRSVQGGTPRLLRHDPVPGDPTGQRHRCEARSRATGTAAPGRGPRIALCRATTEPQPSVTIASTRATS